MKTLYLARHAKSSWDEMGLADHLRPLTTQGETRCGKVADRMRKEGVLPALLISSHAVRAQRTAGIIAERLGYPVKEIHTENVIYDGPAGSILDLIYSTDNRIESLMLVGHNPLISELAGTFIEKHAWDMPTSAVAAIVFGTDCWEEIPMAACSLKFYIYPKMLD
jgi:phosphohistidine phosphatase